MRHLLARVLILAGATCAGLGAVGTTLSRSVFDPVAFGDRAAASLSDPRVADYAADRITRALLSERPDLTAVRPLLLGAARGLAQSDPMRGVVRTAARSAHQALFAEGTRQVALSVPDAGILLRSAFERVSPELGEQIPERLHEVATSLDVGASARVLTELWELRDELSVLVSALLLLAPVLLAGGIALARDRRQGVLATGLGLLAAGALVAAALPLGSHAFARAGDDVLARSALAGLWETCFAGLGAWGLLLGGLGLLFTAASTSLLDEVEPLEWLAAAGRRVVAPPASRFGRLAWATAALASGLFAALAPRVVVAGVVVLLGAAVAFLGARELFRLLLESVEASSSAARAGGAHRSLLRTGLVVGLTIAIAAAWVVLRNPMTSPRPTSVRTCNGAGALCARRLEAVALPGAHNAMSNADIADWMFPHHEKGIPQQLRDGVRALLLDVHYGFPGASRIKTDVRGQRPTQEVLEAALGREGLDAAMRIRERLVGADEGHRDVYLCHGFCELGAYRLAPTLADIRSFLVQNPGEVLVLVVEDYVSPADLAGAFAESGLDRLVYRGPSGPPWPRLRELVAADQNVVVFLESGRGGVPWLRPAFELVQETPYTFHSAEEFSCSPNRGGTTGGLFQLNHWIETTPAPRPSNAERVNASAVLLERARACERERGRLPNIVAVDFYRTGDLFEVAARLNGLPLQAGRMR